MGLLPNSWEMEGALGGHLRAPWLEGLLSWKLSGWAPHWLPHPLTYFPDIPPPFICLLSRPSKP